MIQENLLIGCQSRRSTVCRKRVVCFMIIVTLIVVSVSMISRGVSVKSDNGGMISNDIGLHERIRRARVKRPSYPKRVHMSRCEPKYGTIGIFVAIDGPINNSNYEVARSSIECYVKSTNYKLFYIDVTTDELTNTHCRSVPYHFRFLRHCAAAQYLQFVDWLLFLDGDTGVINPNHCIEEYIDERVNMVFYERFFNHEIASGNYLARKSNFAYEFLMNFADQAFIKYRTFDSLDNGFLGILVLEAAIPNALTEIETCNRTLRAAKTLKAYMKSVICVKVALGPQRVFPGALRILRRGHAWVIDRAIVGHHWSAASFMLHGWRPFTGYDPRNHSHRPFERLHDLDRCGPPDPLSGWHWNPDEYKTDEHVFGHMRQYEEYGIKDSPYVPRSANEVWFLANTEVGRCLPHCEMYT